MLQDKKFWQCLILQLENNYLDTSQPGFLSSLVGFRRQP